jgi:general secretion pathway protein C
MAVDRWVRLGAVAALPVLVAVAWSARTEPPPLAPPPQPPPPELSTLPPAAGTSEVAQAGEKAFAERAARPKPVEHAAATLPPAEGARQPHPLKAARCGGLEARLISVGDDPEWTFASIAPGAGEAARLTRVGDRVGAYRVAAIEWDKVWVQAGGPRCALELHPGFAALGTAEAPPWQVSEAIVTAIDRRSETEFRITRAGVASIFEQGETLLGGVRLVPKTADAAIEIETVPGDSLLDRLGVQAGDVLLALNGATCETPRATLDALLAAREKDRLLARLERGGARFEIELRIE